MARAMLADKGVTPVAAEGFGALGVVVSSTDADIQNCKKFAAWACRLRRTYRCNAMSLVVTEGRMTGERGNALVHR